jgi:hypothetical protein
MIGPNDYDNLETVQERLEALLEIQRQLPWSEPDDAPLDFSEQLAA